MKITAIQIINNLRTHRGPDGKSVRVNVGRRLASMTTSHHLPVHIRINGVWMAPAPKLEALGLEDEFQEGGGKRHKSNDSEGVDWREELRKRIREQPAAENRILRLRLAQYQDIAQQHFSMAERWGREAERLWRENACLKHSIDQERERLELERNPHRDALEDFRRAWLTLFREILRELTPSRWRKEVEA